MTEEQPFYFTRRIGDRHIAGSAKTLCGIPMLSINYDKHRDDAEPCEECERLWKEGKRGD